ncbi:MAG TPA: succinate dehydrogenase/fumarate reductase iron-sulfur subunit [Saprospiraceae bacterium]|nr:succinate dehydrogenase/fumarate reductase iron-sulfur subunit [Saprospiraceae bacterium]
MSNLNLTLHIWRQRSAKDKGEFVSYPVEANAHMSFLEMLDVLNLQLIEQKQEPVAFEHDCREGICGACSMTINGQPHGPLGATTTCQLHMRHYKTGEHIWVEPFRASSFPVIRDLVVDRSAFERIIQAGGYISVNTGQAVDGNTIPIEKNRAAEAFDAAACIGCGACVAACPNGSAMLYVSAKVSHLGLLPQGEVENERRVQSMVQQMDKEGFGKCSNTYACEAECPKEISVSNIARLNRWFLKSSLSSKS